MAMGYLNERFGSAPADDPSGYKEMTVLKMPADMLGAGLVLSATLLGAFGKYDHFGLSGIRYGFARGLWLPVRGGVRTSSPQGRGHRSAAYVGRLRSRAALRRLPGATAALRLRRLTLVVARGAAPSRSTPESRSERSAGPFNRQTHKSFPEGVFHMARSMIVGRTSRSHIVGAQGMAEEMSELTGALPPPPPPGHPAYGGHPGMHPGMQPGHYWHHTPYSEGYGAPLYSVPAAGPVAYGRDRMMRVIEEEPRHEREFRSASRAR